MTEHPNVDWDPGAAEVIRDQRAAYDLIREHCPIAYSQPMGWSIFRHRDIMGVLHDPVTFSSAVSSHRSVPNGMDPPEHTRYRRVIEPYFGQDQMTSFEPACRRIAAGLAREAAARKTVEATTQLAEPFAVRAQCAFLGWPSSMHDQLLSWMERNREANLTQDRPAQRRIAAEFERLVGEVLEVRRHRRAGPETDRTASLMHEHVDGQPLSDEAIASVLRNWTAGEIGTIVAAVSILLHDLAYHPERQAQLRAEPTLIRVSVDEVLRAHGPLVASRRVATRAVELGGRRIEPGERITLMWIAGDRDPEVFDDPDAVRLDRDPDLNLLYGAGVHACPGAPLARMELRVIVEELLRHTSEILPVPGQSPANAIYPSSGWSRLPLELQ
jgi:cytochrome P450